MWQVQYVDELGRWYTISEDRMRAVVAKHYKPHAVDERIEEMKQGLGMTTIAGMYRWEPDTQGG